MTNNGGVDATSIAGAALTLPFEYKGGGYPGIGGTCTSFLAPTDTCDIVVVYRPTTASPLDTDTITLNYDDGVIPRNVAVGLEGTAITPANIAISDAPNFDFGTIAVGSVVEHTFTISNSGATDATNFTEIPLTAPFNYKGGSYPGAGGDCPAAGAIVNGTPCTVVVEFTPTLTGNQPGAMSFNYFCLLYTSPSPRDRTRSRMPSSA